ncbi:FtsX-like permease family protein [Mucilaginibacter sabulilitoris]|uniref:FtsX-like permease family protein n=1 Tax=Mucilaginibacter sabulilitoris TaxID=1173583 RepID=A0ABZ0TWT7_9SPHI|nr:FtsX-like permease family protein [Mucilaginibacter sabulilitoris]WPU95590.1 FtsX-like permease family protein [Mucilaginibacter sabulilitoris]
MNAYTFHITLFDLLCLGVISVGLTFAVLLGFFKKINRTANRLLALTLAIVVLWLSRLVTIDTGLSVWLPGQSSLALGPLIFFYILKMTRPAYQFRWQDLWHFCPLLLPLGDKILQLLAIISVIIYLYRSRRLIADLRPRLKANASDWFLYEWSWLDRLLADLSRMWLLWVPCVVVDYYFAVQTYYPLYLLISIVMIRMAGTAFLREEVPVPVLKPILPSELKQKGKWLKKVVKENRYYQDPELSLSSLAGRLELSTHELSRIVNTALNKSFHDFIHEYRVADVTRKMQDPAYSHITLLGIAYESGFNSKSSFNRIFKEMTGKSPAEYKKEFPVYNLGRTTRIAAVISDHETTPTWTREKLNRNFMFKNYLKVALRFLLKNRFFSLINIIGLAIGTLCCLYILLYVQDQYSYDKHHRNAKNIYRVITSLAHTGDVKNMATASPPIAPAMKNDFPEIIQYTRVVPTLGIKEHLLTYKENAFYESDAVMVDSTFFDVFTYHFTNGSPVNALSDINTIVLLKPVADKLFGNIEPVGKVITMDDADGKNDFKVTGVVDETAGKSQLSAKLFIRLNKHGYGSDILTNNSWAGNNFTNSFVKLRADVNVQDFEKKLPVFLNKYGADQLKSSGMSKSLHLQPLAAIHTTSGYDAESGKIVSASFLYVLILIAVLIQLIACINFMNLSTARASKRAKEVGVRKVIGAEKYELITQFLGESFLLSFIGIAIALPLLWLALPYLNEITEANIQLSFFSDPRLWLMLVVLVIVTGLAAGSYPAFYMSAFRAIKVIKGDFTSQVSTHTLRRSLVIFQFVVAIILITGVVIIYSQLNYIKNRDLGFDKDQQIILTFHTNDTRRKMDVLATDLKQLAEVRSISRSSNTLGALSYYDWGVHLAGGNPADAVDQQNLFTDEQFVKTMGIKLTNGRELMAGDSGKVLINESLAKRLTLDPAKARGTMLFAEDNRKYEIAGVVKDFNYKSLHDEIHSFMIIYAPKADEVNNLIVNTNTKNHGAFLAAVQKVWHKDLPQTPFDYTFMNERMQSAYETDIVLSQIINSFTLIAILISCLGLFGLTAFSAEQRNKEIGIRKVLGASVSGIVQLLSRDFLKLVLIAFIIASPIAWWAMTQWLQVFVYRVSISWWMFAIAALAALVIALFTVSFQAIKAALANPVKSLKSE